MNFRISKFTFGNFCNKFLNAIKRQFLSALTETKYLNELDLGKILTFYGMLKIKIILYK